MRTIGHEETLTKLTRSSHWGSLGVCYRLSL